MPRYKNRTDKEFSKKLGNKQKYTEAKLKRKLDKLRKLEEV